MIDLELKDIDILKPLNRDIKPGTDPNKYSTILREYHRLIWSNRLLKGKPFVLENGDLNKLIYNGDGVKIVFTPDSTTNVFKHSGRKYRDTTEQLVVEQYEKIDSEIANLLKEYYENDYIIGSSIIFPISINDKSVRWTMNIARGILYKIHDRIDLTLECIKRYYDKNDDNPLISSIRRNKPFFDLFDDFPEYIDFFFLNDYVDDNYNVIRLCDDDNFTSPFPKDINQYKEYLSNTIDLMFKRSNRIGDWIKNGN